MFKILAATLMVALIGNQVMAAPLDTPLFLNSLKTVVSRLTPAGVEMKASFSQIGMYSPADWIGFEFVLDANDTEDATVVPVKGQVKSLLESSLIPAEFGVFSITGKDDVYVKDYCTATTATEEKNDDDDEDVITGFKTSLSCVNGVGVKSVSFHATTAELDAVIGTDEYLTGLCFPITSIPATLNMVVECVNDDGVEPGGDGVSTCTIMSAVLVGGVQETLAATVMPATDYLQSTGTEKLDAITYAKAISLLGEGGDVTVLDRYFVDGKKININTYISASSMPCSGADSTVPPLNDQTFVNDAAGMRAQDSYAFNVEKFVATYEWDGKTGAAAVDA